MLCPYCKSTIGQVSWRSQYRRKGKAIRVEARCWQCHQCRTNTGPLRLIDEHLSEQNDKEAKRVWLETFSESMPPPVVGARIRKIMQTEEGRSRVARAFGRVLEQKITEKKL